MSLRFFGFDLMVNSSSNLLLPKLKTLVLNHTMHLLFLVRLGQTCALIPLLGKPLRLIVEYMIRIIYASDISCKAKIGKGLIIVHGHDIVIGADAVIGERCKIFNGVTLGNKDVFQTSKGNQPTIGDNVILSSGAKILGPIKIGNNVIIGANSVVINNFPDNVVIAGIPAKVLKENFNV